MYNPDHGHGTDHGSQYQCCGTISQTQILANDIHPPNCLKIKPCTRLVLLDDTSCFSEGSKNEQEMPTPHIRPLPKDFLDYLGLRAICLSRLTPALCPGWVAHPTNQPCHCQHEMVHSHGTPQKQRLASSWVYRCHQVLITSVIGLRVPWLDKLFVQLCDARRPCHRFQPTALRLGSTTTTCGFCVRYVRDVSRERRANDG